MGERETSDATEPPVPDVAFEKIDSSGTGGADTGYVVAVSMLVGGVLVLLTTDGSVAKGIGIGMVAAGLLIYVHLWRSAPQVRYFRYFWLDQYGLHHIEGGSPAGWTAHFAWHEIAGAEAAPPQDEFPGLILKLHRRGLRGVPVFLIMGGAEEAAAAINDYLARKGQA